MKNIKRILQVTLMTALCSVSVSTAFANSRVVTVQIGSSNATINGVNSSLEVPPYISNSNTMIPLRFVANALDIDDSNIIFEPNTKSISIIQPQTGKEFVFQVGSNQIITKVGSSSTSSTMGNSATAEITDSRTFVPLRELANAFDLEIGWEANTKTVTLTSGTSPLINGQYSIDFIVSEYTKIIEYYGSRLEGTADVDKIGYAFVDINNNGINELLIGSVGDKGSFMELYQIGGNGAELIIQSNNETQVKLTSDGLIACIDSEGSTPEQLTFELTSEGLSLVIDSRIKNFYSLTDEYIINYIPFGQLF